MLAIDREVKDAIESAERKNLILAFDDGTVVDNDDIAMESMELEQSISEEEVLRFGGINSACFKVKIKGTTKEYKNLWFNASLNVGDYSLPLGRFLVNSDVATSDRMYREIVAFDKIYLAMNNDISDWYNGLKFPISIYDMRNSLFDYWELEQVETELINDDYMVNKTLDGNGISGHRALSAICELNAVFGAINAYGQFKYVRINNLVDSGLFPSETLYPSEDLYPQDIYDDCLSKADYKLGSLTYEEFITKNITKVQIREMVNDIGVSVGEDGNTYAIEDNFLVYGDTIENLTVVAQNIFNYAKHLTYTPASLKCNGKPWREVGDMIQVFADDRVFHMPIMNRVLKGIQALTDTYSAQGRETYEEQQEVGYKADLRQLKSRTNVLERNLDETRSEITRVEEDVNGELVKAQTSIKQNAEAINSKVSKGNISTEISQEADQITITGDRFILKATNIQIDEDGNVTIMGKLTTQKGSSIGGFTTDSNSIFNGTWSSSQNKTPTVFMCTGSSSKYTIANVYRDGWCFGANQNWGVSSDGIMYGTQARFFDTGSDESGIQVADASGFTMYITGSEIRSYSQSVDTSSVLSPYSLTIGNAELDEEKLTKLLELIEE